MTERRKASFKTLSPPAQPHQMTIAFESIRLRGMSTPERTRVLMHLANLLMLAAGVAAKGCIDEH